MLFGVRDHEVCTCNVLTWTESSRAFCTWYRQAAKSVYRMKVDTFYIVVLVSAVVAVTAVHRCADMRYQVSGSLAARLYYFSLLGGGVKEVNFSYTPAR